LSVMTTWRSGVYHLLPKYHVSKVWESKCLFVCYIIFLNFCVVLMAHDKFCNNFTVKRLGKTIIIIIIIILTAIGLSPGGSGYQ